jgi:hypothetical protein
VSRRPTRLLAALAVVAFLALAAYCRWHRAAPGPPWDEVFPPNADTHPHYVYGARR